QVVALCFLGGVLGLAAMIPLRKLLIVDANLPYPGGTACAEVLRATSTGARGSAWIFRGMAVGAAIKLLLSLAFLVPSTLGISLPVLPRAELAFELAPALIGVGFILGYRQSAIIVAGSVISSLMLIPLIAWIGSANPAIAQLEAGAIWSRYVRYVGAGAVGVAGILTVLRGLPTMVGAFAAVARGLRRSGVDTERDLSPWCVFGAIGLVPLACFLVP